MATPWPGSARMSSFAVSGFIATSRSIYLRRATYPSLLARMVYHVGSPAMLEGNRFLPETGTPIPKMLFSKTLLADCEPDPLTVATWMLKSLTTRLEASCTDAPEACWPSATSPVAIGRGSLRMEVERYDLSLLIIDGLGSDSCP